MKDREQDGLIIVTGATSGIGKAVAERLARRKCNLMLTGTNETNLVATKEKCLSYGALAVNTSIKDLSKKLEVYEFIAECKKLSPIFSLVNCAGIGKFGELYGYSVNDWDYLLNLNVTAPFILCKELSNFISNSHGNIVNISSDADTQGFEDAEAYCASKGALKMLGRAMRIKLRKLGIRVITISPGRVDTHFNGKQPGMRPGSLMPNEVAEVIEFCIFCSKNIEISELKLDSMSRKVDE